MGDDRADSAFRFNGNWREFAPIAFTNLLLIIVTLGIYRFWAKARERRYLWSRTDFIGDPLEWTGTGKELFIGFLMAILIFGVPLFLMQLVIQGLIFRGQIWLVGLTAFFFPFALLFVMGVARFRALRYRLSRTHWHGIRGGCDQKGLAYGWSYVWKSIVGGLFFGLMLPWSMIELWNQRWNEMSFGSHSFTAGAEYGPLLKRLLALPVPHRVEGGWPPALGGPPAARTAQAVIVRLARHPAGRSSCRSSSQDPAAC